MLFSSTIAVMSIESIKFDALLVTASEIPEETKARDDRLLGVIYAIFLSHEELAARAIVGNFKYHIDAFRQAKSDVSIRNTEVLLAPELGYEAACCVSYSPPSGSRDRAGIIAIARGPLPTTENREPQLSQARLAALGAGLWHATTLARDRRDTSTNQRFSVDDGMSKAIEAPGIDLSIYTEPVAWSTGQV